MSETFCDNKLCVHHVPYDGDNYRRHVVEGFRLQAVERHTMVGPVRPFHLCSVCREAIDMLMGKTP